MITAGGVKPLIVLICLRVLTNSLTAIDSAAFKSRYSRHVLESEKNRNFTQTMAYWYRAWIWLLCVSRRAGTVSYLWIIHVNYLLLFYDSGKFVSAIIFVSDTIWNYYQTDVNACMCLLRCERCFQRLAVNHYALMFTVGRTWNGSGRYYTQLNCDTRVNSVQNLI